MLCYHASSFKNIEIKSLKVTHKMRVIPANHQLLYFQKINRIKILFEIKVSSIRKNALGALASNENRWFKLVKDKQQKTKFENRNVNIEKKQGIVWMVGDNPEVREILQSKITNSFGWNLPNNREASGIGLSFIHHRPIQLASTKIAQNFNQKFKHITEIELFATIKLFSEFCRNFLKFLFPRLHFRAKKKLQQLTWRKVSKSWIARPIQTSSFKMDAPALIQMKLKLQFIVVWSERSPTTASSITTFVNS